jgi:hypothetical protein
MNLSTVLIVLTALAIGFWLVTSQSARDPRCDTAARYDAMREGADCSLKTSP